MTSSVDRECGASLYLVIFAVLLGFPMRQAIALTAFTIFLGSLAPGFAGTAEPARTERGTLALVDYAGVCVILPAMYVRHVFSFWGGGLLSSQQKCPNSPTNTQPTPPTTNPPKPTKRYYGISYGVILNAWLPDWLLAVLVVACIALSNIELVISLVWYLRARRKGDVLAAQLKVEQEAMALAASQGGAARVRHPLHVVGCECTRRCPRLGHWCRVCQAAAPVRLCRCPCDREAAADVGRRRHRVIIEDLQEACQSWVLRGERLPAHPALGEGHVVCEYGAQLLDAGWQAAQVADQMTRFPAEKG